MGQDNPYTQVDGLVSPSHQLIAEKKVSFVILLFCNVRCVY